MPPQPLITTALGNHSTSLGRINSGNNTNVRISYDNVTRIPRIKQALEKERSPPVLTSVNWG